MPNCSEFVPLRARPGRTAALCGALLLAACQSPQVGPPVAPPATPTVTATAAPLAPERSPAPGKTAGTYAWSAQMDDAAQRLKSQFRNVGNVAQTTDQRLWLSLPSELAFVPGRPALRSEAGAWLDRIALVLRDNPKSEVQIVASADEKDRGAGAEALALDRAASARDWLVIRGIAAPRMVVAGQAAKAIVSGAERRLDVLIGERAAPSKSALSR